MPEQPHRRSTRVLVKLPIKVSGIGESGQQFEEETATVVIDGHGAQIALKNSPQVGGKLTITDLRNGKSGPFRVVSRVSQAADAGVEWGVESLDPGVDLWGIHFPVKASPARSEMIEALLECRQCGSKEISPLTQEEYKTLGKQPFLKRECAKCAAPTDWSFSYIEEADSALDEPGLSSQPAPSSDAGEKRKAKRLSVKLPVRIRLADGREETAETENLSKTGFSVISGTMMSVGDIIQIDFENTKPGSGTEVRGRIIWRQALGGTDKAIYGVRLLDSP